MLQSEIEFPGVGAMAFRLGTAEPARITRRNDDGSAMVVRHRRLPGGGTVPLSGASATVTVPLEELFADEDAAMFGGRGKARRAARSRARGRAL